MGNATLIIKIQDIQNKPPYFTGQPYNAKIPEEKPIGTPVSTDYMFKYIFSRLNSVSTVTKHAWFSDEK